MVTQEVCTVIGYDADTGKRLFTLEGFVSRDDYGVPRLPQCGQPLRHDGKKYHVVGVRKHSRPGALWQVDLREAPPE
jgi:hypothetical protein